MSVSRDRAYRTLRHRDFRLLWAAGGISSAGTQIQQVAVAWQVFELSRSPVALGGLGLARFVPILVSASPAGCWPTATTGGGR